MAHNTNNLPKPREQTMTKDRIQNALERVYANGSHKDNAVDAVRDLYWYYGEELMTKILEIARMHYDAELTQEGQDNGK